MKDRREQRWAARQSTHSQPGWPTKSPSRWAAFSQGAAGPQDCEFEGVGLALASHLKSKGCHSNMQGGRGGEGNESGAGNSKASLSYPGLFHLFLLHCIVCVCVCACVCRSTSPGIVVVGHSVCGLDGGEVRLQGKQLTGQVWHAAGGEQCDIYASGKKHFY